jgi:TIR domain
MGHVFISYSRHDRAYVDRLAAHLKDQGEGVWYDREIASGDRWSTVVKRQIETCDAMIVVMSPTAETSEMVENEIDLARSRGKPLVPLLLEGEPFFGLRHLHYTDVRAARDLPGTEFTRRAHTGTTTAVGSFVEQILSEVRRASPSVPLIQNIVASGQGSMAQGVIGGNIRNEGGTARENADNGEVEGQQ